jgi:hypothetical protein
MLTEDQLRLRIPKEHRIDIPNPINCAGYPTSNPNENFCSTHTPENWVENQFNDKQYFLVPLLGIDRENTSKRITADFND